MGLPQVPSELEDEVTTPPCTVVSAPPEFDGVRTSDHDWLHIERTENMICRSFSCSSIGGFQRKTVNELQNASDGSHQEKIIVDGPVNLHKLKINSMDKNTRLSPSVKHNIHTPVLRVVGFESHGSASLVNSSERASLDRVCSSTALGVSDSSVESHGLQLRKRLLSPSSGIVAHDKFPGELLNLPGGSDDVDSRILDGRVTFFKSQDSKKANIGNFSVSQTAECTLYGRSKLSDMLHNDALRSRIFIDGPLVQTKEHQHPMETSPYGEKGKTKGFTGEIAISPRKLNSLPLSMSPLGRKLPVRMKTSKSRTYFSKEFKGGQLVVSNWEKSLDYVVSEILVASEEDELRAANDTFEDVCSPRSDLDPFILQSHANVCQKWGPESASAPQYVNFVRSLGGLPVRRSLIGSFEESLLSGHFSSSKDGQRLDGFLAILNVTGGNFSPPSRKLPFSVTSVDGDSSLLYYASIDLAGNSKCKGPKMKRSLSNEDSRALKCRLRIPVKGCIQLEHHQEASEG